VNWLGYPGTLGHPRLADYIIGDPVVTPESHAEFYSERLALMPHCYQPNDHLRPLPEAPQRGVAGLPENSLIFCSFNQVVKFNPQTFDIWSRLLVAVPNSVLWLLRPKSSVVVENLKQEMKARGISEDRIVFAEFAHQKEHLARLRLADIALDTFPYNSHTTASDALWMGVPVITRKGKTFASRVAESLLTAHGFPDLVAGNPEEYFQLALELAKNGKKRGKLRKRLERARTVSPLFDTARFTAIAENHNQPEETRPRVVTLG
jgi:predicted O-linked N-acetylglucosamine transferase (SPINDLY family)